jgi:hypothetical protein
VTTATGQYQINFVPLANQNPWVDPDWTGKLFTAYQGTLQIRGAPTAWLGQAGGQSLYQANGLSYDPTAIQKLTVEVKTGASTDRLYLSLADSSGNGYIAEYDPIAATLYISFCQNWVVVDVLYPAITGIPGVNGDLFAISVQTGNPDTIIAFLNGAEVGTRTKALSHGTLMAGFGTINNNAGTAGAYSLAIDGLLVSSGPSITTITPTRYSEPFTITGTGFGDAQGTVSIGGLNQTVNSWTNTSITCGCSRGTLKFGTYDLVVTDSLAETATASTDLLPATNWDHIDLAGTLAPSVNRLTATPTDLAAGMQVSWQANQSGKAIGVYSDASFVCDATVTSFPAQAWSSTDGWGTNGTQTITQVAAVAPIITTTALNTLRVGTAFSQTLAATGDVPITWTHYAGTIPPGLTLSTAGVLSGTPTTAAAYNFTVEASNAAGADTQVYTGSVLAALAAPIITTPSLNTLRVGVAFSEQVEATGNPAPTFATVSGAVAGLSISSTGLITGTPTTSGAYNWTVRATNSQGADDQLFTGTVLAALAAPTWVTSVLPSMFVGVPYDETVVANGNPPPTYSLFSGSLPAGLSLASNGNLTGTPTSAVAYSFTLRASNSQGNSDRLFTGNVSNALAAPTIQTTVLNPMYSGVAFSQQIQHTGNPDPTLAVSAGTLPAGLSLSTSGLLSGTPTTLGAYSFTVTATNSQGSANQAYSGSVVTAPAIPVTATINDIQMAVIKTYVGAGHTYNDGMLAYYRLDTGVTATTLSEAEQDWLSLRTSLVDDFTDDLWHQYLRELGYSGTNDDMKHRYWLDVLAGSGISVITKEFTFVYGQISASSVGYKLSPATGTISPDDTFAGGQLIQFASNDNDDCYIYPAGSTPFPSITQELWVSGGNIPYGDSVHMVWNIDRYEAAIPGVYTQMRNSIGIPMRIRLSGDKV